jgi:signal transduction histidine kinase
MRRLLGVLRGDRPPALEPQPGLGDLEALLMQVRRAGLPVTLTERGVPGDWGPVAGLSVYRVVQEALTNTIKHAGPGARATVCLSYSPAGVQVEVQDDGTAAPRAGPGEGHGLAGIRERVAAFGGRLEAGPAPGGGWRLAATLGFAGEGGG